MPTLRASLVSAENAGCKGQTLVAIAQAVQALEDEIQAHYKDLEGALPDPLPLTLKEGGHPAWAE